MTTTARRRGKVPESRGAPFRASVLAEYELAPDERELLAEAADTLDLIDGLRVTISADGLTVPGYHG